MSVVVGVESVGGVWLASDAFIGGEDRDRIASKIWRTAHGIGVGSVGRHRTGQIAGHYLTAIPPTSPADVERWAVSVLVPELRELVDEHGLEGDDGDDGPYTLLVAVCGQLWHVLGDFTVYRSTHGYGAIGSGAAYAYGSLATTDDVYSAEDRARRAVVAASRHCSQVCEPVFAQIFDRG